MPSSIDRVKKRSHRINYYNLFQCDGFGRNDGFTEVIFFNFRLWLKIALDIQANALRE